MASKTPDVALLKTLSPLNGLKPENLQNLAAKAKVEQTAAGRFIFKQGDADKRSIYVLDGEIELRAGDEVVRTVKGGSPEAKNPIAPQIPRTVSARAKNDVAFLVVDSDLLDVMLTWDQTGSFEVSELSSEEDEGGGDDWMASVLASKAFHRIPPANIQLLFMRMEPVVKKAGEKVISQGEDGDYFYVITEGKAVVTRETPTNKQGIKLAELAVGDTFGEEALISESKRNATITMISDGQLMRLSKENFATLLHEPTTNSADYETAKAEVDAGNAIWLDVRLPTEFQNEHEEGALNIPLVFLRLKLNQVPQEKKVIVYCDTGRRSSAAAFILTEKGYDVAVLKGGLAAKDGGG